MHDRASTSVRAKLGPLDTTPSQFRIWGPARQKTWLTEMHRRQASGSLSEEQQQNLRHCQSTFDAGF